MRRVSCLFRLPPRWRALWLTGAAAASDLAVNRVRFVEPRRLDVLAEVGYFH